MTDVKIEILGRDVESVIAALMEDDDNADRLTVDRKFLPQEYLASEPISVGVVIGAIAVTAIAGIVKVAVAKVEAGRQLEAIRFLGTLPVEVIRELAPVAVRHPSLIRLGTSMNLPSLAVLATRALPEDAKPPSDS